MDLLGQAKPKAPDIALPIANGNQDGLFCAVLGLDDHILRKETVDEIIFRTTRVRNRLMLEPMARDGMRIGEVLNLTPKDIDEQKLTIRDPKSGKEEDVVFIPRRWAGRPKGLYRAERNHTRREDIPVTYSAARVISKKAGLLVGVQLRPHDLRRHAETHASRSGIPFESSTLADWFFRLSRQLFIREQAFNRTTNPHHSGYRSSVPALLKGDPKRLKTGRFSWRISTTTGPDMKSPPSSPTRTSSLEGPLTGFIGAVCLPSGGDLASRALRVQH